MRRLERILVLALGQEYLSRSTLAQTKGRFARPGLVFSHIRGKAVMTRVAELATLPKRLQLRRT